MPPLAFSDAELDVIMNLAQPLDPVLRDPFLRAVAIELARYQPEAIGPGADQPSRPQPTAAVLGGAGARCGAALAGRVRLRQITIAQRCFPGASPALPWEAASR